MKSNLYHNDNNYSSEDELSVQLNNQTPVERPQFDRSTKVNYQLKKKQDIMYYNTNIIYDFLQPLVKNHQFTEPKIIKPLYNVNDDELDYENDEV